MYDSSPRHDASEKPPRADAPSAAARAREERALYDRYLPMVNRIAMRLARQLPSSITVDDLVGAGWVGLIESARRRPPNMPEEEFEAWASYRVRGALLDHLRSLDPMSRRMRGASKRITGAIRDLTRQLGRAPEEPEIAAALGIDLEEYRQLLEKVMRADVVRVEVTDFTTLADAGDRGPEAMASKRQVVDRVATAIDKLPEKLKLVVGLYYQEDCNLREIGEILGVTESRVCQLRSEAVHRIRAIVVGGDEERT